jgi:hypothetical protein
MSWLVRRLWLIAMLFACCASARAENVGSDRAVSEIGGHLKDWRTSFVNIHLIWAEKGDGSLIMATSLVRSRSSVNKRLPSHFFVPFFVNH